MPRPPSDGIREDLTCLECGRAFTLWRTDKNRNAKIRFCDDCRRRHADEAQPRGISSVPRKKAVGRG